MRQVLRRERYLQRAQVLLEVRASLRAGNGDDVFSLREDPCQRELRGPAALAGGHLADARDEVEILLEVLALEARRQTAVVVGRQILEARDLSGQEAAPERAVGDEPDAELAARGE